MSITAPARLPASAPRSSRDIAREVTRMIIARLEAGTKPWTRPWSLTGEGGRPLRHEGTPTMALIASGSGRSPTRAAIVRATG